MTQHDLKPCPFCGGEATIEVSYSKITGVKDRYYPSCLDGDCPAFIVGPYSTYGTKREAAEQWNSRPTPAGDAVERVARMMNENIEAREIAKQEDADAYDDSEPRVQDYWQALARAAIAAMGGAGWRPIETAPRDGSKIDVWIEDARHTNVFWGRPDHSCGEAGDYCDCCPSYDAWVCADMNDYLTGDEGFACDDPTHWMPLPPSPAAA